MNIGQALYDLWNLRKGDIDEIIKSPIHIEVLLTIEAPLFLCIHLNILYGDNPSWAIELIGYQLFYLFMEIRFSRLNISDNDISLGNFFLAMAELEIYKNFSHLLSPYVVCRKLLVEKFDILLEILSLFNEISQKVSRSFNSFTFLTFYRGNPSY